MSRYRSLLVVYLFTVVSVGIAGCEPDGEIESAPDANSPEKDAASNACTPESDEAFCRRIGTECGLVIADDNCGDQRSASCDVDCPTCDGVDVSLADGDGGSFSVDSTSVDEDGDVVFFWASMGACQCSGSLQGADWPAWDNFEGPLKEVPPSASPSWKTTPNTPPVSSAATAKTATIAAFISPLRKTTTVVPNPPLIAMTGGRLSLTERLATAVVRESPAQSGRVSGIANSAPRVRRSRS